MWGRKKPKQSAGGSDFKSRFTAEEWHLAMSVPFMFFGMAAASDGSVDPAETAEFGRRMASGALGYKDPLHREVASDFFASPVTGDDLIRKANAFGPDKIRDMLRSKLTTDEYQSYVSSAFVDAHAVANAHGGLSQSELQALTALAIFFGVDVAGLPKRFGRSG